MPMTWRDVGVDDAAVAHRRHLLARMGGDDLLDRLDHAGAELVRIDAGGAVDVTGEHVLPARAAPPP